MNKQIKQMIKKLKKAAPLQIPEDRPMTSKQLLPRFNDMLGEINQMNNQIDYDDPAADALQALLELATQTKTEMQTGATA